MMAGVDGTADWPAQARARGHASAGDALESDDPRVAPAPTRDRFVGSGTNPGPLPKKDEDIAFATVVAQSSWIKSRALTSERLTRIYIERCERLDPKLRSIITLTKDVALAQAKQADAEIAAGKYRGPLHGIPFGVKDLLDTKGILTTYGAEFYRNRVPQEDSAVVDRLQKAGAVLLAKLSLGALALNDVWFGGQTMNPWLLEEGSGGSSAGPGSATAAALVSFSVGSETGGSIIDPTMRCGLTGLRPTFGRVPRTGAMTLSWTCDKLGPMTRGVEDAMLVVQAISGPDPGDLYSVPSHLDFDATGSIRGMKLGYIPKWMKEEPATALEPAALEALTKLGMTPVEVELPDWPYDSLGTVVSAEGAAAFEEQTLSGKMNELKMQVPDAWPNIFRQARFLSAVDFVQADRLRRKVGHRDGEGLPKGGRAPDAADARRNPDDHELHRASRAGSADGFRGGHGGAQRLGPGSQESACPPSRRRGGFRTASVDRPALRRRNDRDCGNRSRKGLGRGGREAAGVLASNPLVQCAEGVGAR